MPQFKRFFVHRDIKCENVLVDAKGKVKLSDFSDSTHWRKDKLMTWFFGTLAYNFPGILQRKPYDERKADVWTMTMLFFKLATGDLPFDAEEPDEILDLIKKQRFNFKPQVSQLETDLIYGGLGVSESKRPTASVFLVGVRLLVR